MITFVVPGIARPKGSRIAGKRNDGTTFTRPASKYEKAWTEAVVAAARGQGRLSPPYSVSLVFRFARPGKPSWGWPTKQDLDKVSRSTIDGLVLSGVIEGDQHVVKLWAEKAWADSDSCTVTVRRG